MQCMLSCGMCAATPQHSSAKLWDAYSILGLLNDVGACTCTQNDLSLLLCDPQAQRTVAFNLTRKAPAAMIAARAMLAILQSCSAVQWQAATH